MPKQDKAKSEWWNKSTNLHFFFDLKHRKFWCSQNAMNQSKSTVKLGFICPGGQTVHQQWHS